METKELQSSCCVAGCPENLLCSRLPRELAALLTYTRALSFAEEPNYDYMQSMLPTLHSDISDLSAVLHDLSHHKPIHLTSKAPPPPSHSDVGPHGPDHASTPLLLAMQKTSLSSAACNAATPCAPHSRKWPSRVTQSSPVGQTAQTPKQMYVISCFVPFPYLT
jgi:hypothetical protein